jgi:hypothetical protein
LVILSSDFNILIIDEIRLGLSMYRTQEEIEKDIKELIEDLNSIILEDNEITTDEQDILATMEANFMALKEEAALQSNLDEKEFHLLLKEYMQDIVSEVVLLSKDDGVISHSELKMINRIQDFIANIDL